MNKIHERRKGIESLARKYSNVPMEAILKNDLLRLGAAFSDAALKACEGCCTKSYRLFTYDKVKYSDLAKGEHFKVPEVIKLFGGQYRLRETAVQVRLNPQSPYEVDVIDGQVVLCGNGANMADVRLPPAPKYYYKTFPDGTGFSEVVAWVNAIAFATVYTVCQYWGTKRECKFCDINKNVRQAKDYHKLFLPKTYKPVEQVVEVMEEIFMKEQEQGFDERPLSFIVTGGCIPKLVNGKNEDEFYLEYVERIRDRIGNRWPGMLQTAPKDKKTYKRYKAAGVTTHHAQIEVWDKDLFEIICPGKGHHVGWDTWIKGILDAVDVFGEGNVTPGFVAGVEMCQPYGFRDIDSALQSMTEGFEFLMSHGVSCRYNVWNISPWSALAGNLPPPLEYYVRLDQAWCETLLKYNLRPPTGFGEMGPGRAVCQHAAYMDMDPIKILYGR